MWPNRLWTFLKTAGRDGLMLLFALRDPETPRLLKLGIVALALYAVSPIDLIPDVVLLLGWADDLALLMIGIPFLARRLPVGARARASLRAEQLLGRLGAWRA
jgi:uncharacterized membrane protein YkvA (DUF1232 family)